MLRLVSLRPEPGHHRIFLSLSMVNSLIGVKDLLRRVGLILVTGFLEDGFIIFSRVGIHGLIVEWDESENRPGGVIKHGTHDCGEVFIHPDNRLPFVNEQFAFSLVGYDWPAQITVRESFLPRQ